MITNLEALKTQMDDVAECGGSIKALTSAFLRMLESGESEVQFNEFFARNHGGRGFLSLLSGRNFAMHENDRFMLAFGVEREPRKLLGEISSISQSMIFGLLTPVEFTIQMYRKCVGDLGHFDMTDQVELVKVETLSRHDVAFFDAESIFVNIAFDRKYVSLNLSEKVATRSITERYDAVSGRAKYASAANSDLTRIEYACEVLKELGNSESVLPLRKLCAHPAHFVRWKAVEALINVDYGAGVDVIREMQTDAHPHIRVAASQALRSLIVEVA